MLTWYTPRRTKRLATLVFSLVVLCCFYIFHDHDQHPQSQIQLQQQQQLQLQQQQQQQQKQQQLQPPKQLQQQYAETKLSFSPSSPALLTNELQLFFTDKAAKEAALYDADVFRINFQAFYTSLLHIMEDTKREIPTLLFKYEKKKGLSKSALGSIIHVSPRDLLKGKKMHQTVMNEIPDSFPRDLYQGDGVVIVGGGRFSWLAMLGIKSMRSFGSKLPVEVLIPEKKEYDAQFCEVVLPALNAKCLKLWEILGRRVTKTIKFKGYQYKSLALIASSFERVFLFDADNILVSNPDELFSSEVFEKFGMITWPDYWERTTSPLFYKMIDQPVDETLKVREGPWPLEVPQKVDNVDSVNYHDLNGTMPDLSTESGQFLINKRTHIRTILLSLFYNLHGPNLFYPLLSQGQLGEGDKDTFVAAALRGGEPFYQVKSGIRTFGWHGTFFHGVAMGQRNPMDDYAQFLEYSNSNLDLDGYERFKGFNPDSVPIFAIHANVPKLHPIILLEKDSLVDEKGRRVRIYNDISDFLTHIKGDTPYDFEQEQFETMEFLLCQMKLQFKSLDGMPREDLCRFINGHLEFLKRNPV